MPNSHKWMFHYTFNLKLRSFQVYALVDVLQSSSISLRDLDNHVRGRGVSPGQSPLISIDWLEERSGFDPGVKLDLTFAKSLHVNFLFSYFAFLVGWVPWRNPPYPSVSRDSVVATGILTSQGGTKQRATFAQFECHHLLPYPLRSTAPYRETEHPYLIPFPRVLEGPLCCALPHLNDARQNAKFTSRQIQANIEWKVILRPKIVQRETDWGTIR